MGFHQRFIVPIIVLMFTSCGEDTRPTSGHPDKNPIEKPHVDRDVSTPDPEVIRIADSVSATFSVPDKRHVVVIDYDRSLYAVRLFVVDMRKKQIILRSRVSHAKNSGGMFATEFSNTSSSQKSCTGAFKTAEPYYGKFGYSMRLDGLQKGLNDNARARAIVFHDFDKIPAYSQGCFMTTPQVNRQLIDLVKGGSLVYVRKSGGEVA